MADTTTGAPTADAPRVQLAPIASGSIKITGADPGKPNQTKQIDTTFTIQSDGIRFRNNSNTANPVSLAELLNGKLQGPIGGMGKITLSSLPAPLNAPFDVTLEYTSAAQFTLAVAAPATYVLTPHVSFKQLALRFSANQQQFAASGAGTISLFGTALALELGLAGGALSFTMKNGTPIVLDSVGALTVSLLTATAQAGGKEWGISAMGSLTPSLPAPLDRAFDVELEFRSDRTRVALAYAGELPIVPDNLILSDCQLAFEKKGADTWQIGGKLTATLFDAPISLEADFEREGNTRIVSLSTDHDKNIDIDGLGQVKLKALALKMTQVGATRAWDVSARGSLRLSALPAPLNGSFDLGMSLEKGKLWLEATQHEDDMLAIVPNDFTLSGVDVRFTRGGGELTAEGSVSATLYGHGFGLAASYAGSGEGRSFTLSYANTGGLPQIAFDDPIELNLKSFELSTTRAGTDSEWSLVAGGELALPNIPALAGTLELKRAREGEHTSTSLAFTSEREYTFDIPLEPGSDDYVVTLGITPRSLSIENETVRPPLNGRTTRWRFESAAELKVSGIKLPAGIPDSYAVTFHADASGVGFTLDHVIDGAPVPLPTLSIAGEDIALGELVISMSDLDVTLGGEIGVAASISAEVPAELNVIFGRDEAHPFFDGSLDVRLKANSLTGVGVTIERLPIAKTVWDTKVVGSGADKRVLQVLDLGEFGHVEFELPTFSFKNGAFAASGYFAQRDLGLPLKPLKRMLAGMGLGVVENLLPDKVDLEEIDLLGPNDKLDADAFMKLIDASDIDLPKDAFRTVIDTIADEVDRLPLAFREYLKIVPPDELSFAIAFSIDGGIRFDIEAQGDKPLKLLMPGATPLPGLTGITLRKATLGEILSGSLLLFGLDVEVDFFDLHALAGALLLPDAAEEVLPDTADIHRTLVVKDLLALVIYETGIPIPIPLFYERLGGDYLGIEGLGLGMQWSFPMPAGGVFDLIGLFTDMKPFFFDKDYYLPAPGDPGYDAAEDDLFAKHKLGLDFSIKPAYLTLPEYLGGKTLGYAGAAQTDSAAWSVSLTQAFAQIMNTMKNPQLGRYVRMLPLDKRVGAERIEFGPMEASAAWAITTDAEYSQALVNGAPGEFGAQLERIPPAERAQLLDIIKFDPRRRAGTSDDGAIALLLGDWSVGSLIALEARLGLAQSASMGYGFGFGFKGAIGRGFMDFETAGSAVIDVDNRQAPVLLDGHSQLKVLDHEIFSGDIQLDGDGFEMSGRVQLFPRGSAFQVSGNGLLSIRRNGDVRLHADGGVEVFGLDIIDSTLDITNDNIRLGGTLLGQHASLEFARRQRKNRSGQAETYYVLQGDLGLDLKTDLHLGPVRDLMSELIVIERSSYRSVEVAANLHVEVGTEGFLGTVTGGFKWNDRSFSIPEFTLHAPPVSRNALLGLIIAAIKENIDSVFEEGFGGLKGYFDAARDGIITIGRRLRAMAEAAIDWVEGAWDHIKNWTLGAWQSVVSWGENAWNATKQWGIDAWKATSEWTSTAWQATTEWTEDAWKKTLDWGEEEWNNSAKTIVTAAEKAASEIEDLLNKVGGGVTDLGDQVTQHFTKFGEEIEHGFEDGWKDVKDFFSSK
jgi:hypothetical protein